MNNPIQAAFDIVEQRRKATLDARADGRTLMPGELNQLIAELEEHNRNANWPVKLVRNYEGDDWLLAFGESGDESIHVTTDHVRVSEMTGTAEDDAACYVYLRNNLPVILTALRCLLSDMTKGTGR